MKYWKSYPSRLTVGVLAGVAGIATGCTGTTIPSVSASPQNSTNPPAVSIPKEIVTTPTAIPSQSRDRASITPTNPQVKQQTQSITNKDSQSSKQSEPTIAAAKALIPNGWILEQETLGDLNGDGRADIALKLIQSGSGVRQRALLVLLSTPSGWQKLAFAPKLLLCSSCGGVMGTDNGSHIRVEINDRILVVYQLRGSRSAIQTIHRFWIDRDSQELVCIGEDINPYDRANGNQISDSRNFLTGKRIIIETRGKHSRSQDPLRSMEVQISRQLQSIESIDIEQASNSAPSLPSD